MASLHARPVSAPPVGTPCLRPGTSFEAPFRFGSHSACHSRDGSDGWSVHLYRRKSYWLGKALASDIAVLPEPDALVAVTGTVVDPSQGLAIWIRRLTPIISLDATHCVFDFAAPDWVVDQSVLDRARAVWGLLGRDYRLFVNALFLDAPLLKAFLSVPASRAHHHAYRGGCIAHSVETAELAATVAAAVPGVDRDLLVTSALVHDCGKALEYEMDDHGKWRFTSYARLIGHKVAGIQLATMALSRCPTLDAKRREALLHALCCSYAPSWVGLRAPASREAALASTVDRLSAEAANPRRLIGQLL